MVETCTSLSWPDVVAHAVTVAAGTVVVLGTAYLLLRRF